MDPNPGSPGGSGRLVPISPSTADRSLLTQLGLPKGLPGQVLPRVLMGRWWPLAATLAGGWALADSLHLSSVLPLVAAGAGCWLLARRRPAVAAASLPRSSEGWIARCQTVLAQFERLEGQGAPGQAQRHGDLEALKQQQQRQRLDVALSGCRLPEAGHQAAITAAITANQASRLPMRLYWSHPCRPRAPIGSGPRPLAIAITCSIAWSCPPGR